MPRNSQHVPHADRAASVRGAARAVLIANGYHDATMADIARAADLTPNAVRWYLPTKDDALASTVDALIEEYLPPSAGRDVSALIDAVMQLRAYNGLAAAVLEREALSPAVAESAHRLHAILGQLLDHAAPKPLADPARTALLAVLLNEIAAPRSLHRDGGTLRYTIDSLMPGG